VATSSVTLAQYALNIAIPLQQQMLQGAAEPATKGDYIAVLGAIACLAESLIIINNASTGGGTIPNSLLTGKYSVTQPSTSAIQT
jgi:hypothetical protein